MAAGQQETLSVASLEVSRRLLQQAVGVDPAYAQAHAALALNSLELVEHGALDPVEGRTTARYSAERALDLSPRLADAHLASALVSMRTDYRWQDAERELRVYVQLSPQSAAGLRTYANLVGARGRFDEALRIIERAIEADPAAVETPVHAARLLLFAGRYREAIDRVRGVVARAPRFAAAYKVLSDALWADGEILAAERAYLEWLSALSIDAQEFARARALVENGGLPALWRSNLSRSARTGPYRYGAPFKEASIYAAMGEANRALDALEAAEVQRDSQLIFVKVNPLFTALRGEPRFEALLGRLSL